MATTALTFKVDAEALRRSIYSKDMAGRADLARLLAMGAEAGDDPAFLALVADVAADALVLEVDPRGYVSDADAQWLIQQIGDGAGLTCRAECEALKAVIGHSVSAPPALVAFAVREVERSILSGRRTALGGVDHAQGVVTAADVEALRMFCFAPTAGAACHVDRPSAEALFDIAHATAGADNDPGFPDFFAKAVGNYLIGAVFLQTASRDEELALERELDHKPGFGEFLSGLTGGLFAPNAATGRRSVGALTQEIVREENDAAEARLEAASRLDGAGAQWILAHLTREGDLTLAEKRLLAFLRDEAASAPPEIAALYAKAA